MKEIKITLANAQKIEAVLHEINAKKIEHTYTSFDDIESLVADAESRLVNLLGAKKHFVGALFDATSGAAVPNAYKYSRIGTHVTLTRKAGGWYLADVVSTVIYKDAGKKSLKLTCDQDAIACEKMRKNYILQSLSA